MLCGHEMHEQNPADGGSSTDLLPTESELQMKGACTNKHQEFVYH